MFVASSLTYWIFDHDHFIFYDASTHKQEDYRCQEELAADAKCWNETPGYGLNRRLETSKRGEICEQPYWCAQYSYFPACVDIYYVWLKCHYEGCDIPKPNTEECDGFDDDYDYFDDDVDIFLDDEQNPLEPKKSGKSGKGSKSGKSGKSGKSSKSFTNGRV